MDRARIWEVPDPRPPMILPALTPDTARRFAAQVDGLITVNQPLADLREMIAAYRAGGGTGKAILQVHVSWAETEDEAAAIAHEQWRTNVFDPPVMADLALPEDYERRAEEEQVTVDDVRGAVNVSADLDRHVHWLQQYRDIGFDEIYLHHVGQEQGPFLEAFGRNVLPRLR